MKMRAASVLVTLIIAISSLYAQLAERKLILSIGGGLPAARQLTIKTLGTGDFSATGFGLPFTDSGLAKFEYHRAIGEADSARLFAFSSQAAREWRGTGESWPDCKGAKLDIQGGAERIHTASGCISDAWLS